MGKRAAQPLLIAVAWLASALLAGYLMGPWFAADGPAPLDATAPAPAGPAPAAVAPLDGPAPLEPVGPEPGRPPRLPLRARRARPRPRPSPPHPRRRLERTAPSATCA